MENEVSVFPLTIPIGSLEISAHPLFEFLAYLLAFRQYRAARVARGDVIDTSNRWTIIAAATVGAAAGSKILHHLASPTAFLANVHDPMHWLGGKTIVGGLLGGLIAVEGIKRLVGIRGATGDLFAIPLVTGIVIGRVGCFLAGVTDDTHGVATSWLIGMDLGDGIARHPTALYEIVFCVALIPLLRRASRANLAQGDVFKLFMIAYLAFRLGVDFLKPYERLAGLGGIQWACIAGLVHYARHLPRLVAAFRREPETWPTAPKEASSNV